MELSNYSRKKDGETNNINSATTPVEKTKKKRHRLVLPYQGSKGGCLIKSLQKRLKNVLFIESTS